MIKHPNMKRAKKSGKKIRITEVEKFQIAASSQKRLATHMRSTREQRRPITKIIQQKGPSGNTMKMKDTDIGEVCRKQQDRATKNVYFLTK